MLGEFVGWLLGLDPEKHDPLTMEEAKRLLEMIAADLDCPINFSNGLFSSWKTSYYLHQSPLWGLFWQRRANVGAGWGTRPEEALTAGVHELGHRLHNTEVPTSEMARLPREVREMQAMVNLRTLAEIYSIPTDWIDQQVMDLSMRSYGYAHEDLSLFEQHMRMNGEDQVRPEHLPDLARSGIVDGLSFPRTRQQWRDL